MDPAMYRFGDADVDENDGLTASEAVEVYGSIEDREELVHQGPGMFSWYEEDEALFEEADELVQNDLYEMVEDWFPRVQQLVEQYRDGVLDEEVYEDAVRDAVVEAYPITVERDVSMNDHGSAADGAINNVHFWLEEVRQRFDLSYGKALRGDQ